MDEDAIPLADLDGDSAMWVQLSDAAYQARMAGAWDATNEQLSESAHAKGADGFAAAYMLWRADNLMGSKRMTEAVTAYQEHAERFGDRKLNGGSWRPVALEGAAQAQERSGQPKEALATYSALLDGATDGASRAWVALQAARVAEHAMVDNTLATEWYARASAESDDGAVFEIPVADLAKRDVTRLQSDQRWIRNSATQLALELANAVRTGNEGSLLDLASPTHMRVGVAGSEVRFAEVGQTVEILAELFRDGALCDPGDLQGQGDKRYLAVVPGTPGSPYASMHLLLCRCSVGWEWAGAVWTVPDDSLATLMPPAPPMKNQPLPNQFFKAPWPAGVSFRAGGVLNFGAEALAVATLPFGWIVAATLSAGPAGWGPAGFYYNQFGHSGPEQAFAIDFTRYRQFAPLAGATGGTPVLCVSAGVVSMTRRNFASGDPTLDNRVEVNHVVASSDWSRETLSLMAPTRLRAKNLHLAGPNRIPVSVGMSVPRGATLGFMDDTGFSAFDHLHFSVHDRDMGFQSVRINPLDGQRLNDGDNYRVVTSTNVPGRG